jgi:amino acid transporter
MTTQPKLKRVVTTWMLALYGTGNIIGAGVYVLIGKIAEPAGYLSVLAFLVAAVVAFCAALSYAELASRFPVSAGVAVYLHEAFKKPWLSTAIGLFLVIAGAVSIATLLKGFAGYFVELVPVSQLLVMAVAILILLAITIKGVKESVGFAAILTAVEVGGLLFLIGSILFSQPTAIGDFSGHFMESLGHIDAAAMAGIASAAFIAFYAFIGFEDMVNIAEEVKEPQKAFPRAIMIAMVTVTLLYVLVAVTVLGVVTPDVLGGQSAPLAHAYASATGNSAGIIIVVSLIATLNGIIVNMIMGSRFLYGMARRGWIPAWFGKVSGRHVPTRGLWVVALVALGGAALLPISQLAQLTSLLLLFVFFAVNLSLVIIRRRDTKENFHMRLSHPMVPWFGVLASGALLVSQAASMLFT